MVNEVVGTGDWEEESSLGETWKSRNVFSYGRNEGTAGGVSGTARPEVLDKLLTTTERVVQEICFFVCSEGIATPGTVPTMQAGKAKLEVQGSG